MRITVHFVLEFCEICSVMSTLYLFISKSRIRFHFPMFTGACTKWTYTKFELFATYCFELRTGTRQSYRQIDRHGGRRRGPILNALSLAGRGV